MFMTPERLPYLDYLSMILPTQGVFVFRAPPLSYVSNIYYLPFVGMVWICSGVLVILATILVFLTFRFPREKDQPFIFSDFVLYAVSTICQMGSSLSPKRASGRIAMVCKCLCLFSKFNFFLFGFSVLVFILFGIDIHLYIVYGKYCCIVTINIEKYSNINRFTKFKY